MTYIKNITYAKNHKYQKTMTLLNTRSYQNYDSLKHVDIALCIMLVYYMIRIFAKVSEYRVSIYRDDKMIH